MATVEARVLLGYRDELITEKYYGQLNYTTNKVGGKPNWAENKTLPNPTCPLCNLALPLIVQIYAPLEKSSYHRTLYLFGCVNPYCWNKNESWVCLRSQLLDKNISEHENLTETKTNFDWCEGANDWESLEDPTVYESFSGEPMIISESNNLSQKITSLEIDSKEMVCTTEAVTQFLPEQATAEIEGEESEVTIDTPSGAEVDMDVLFNKMEPALQVKAEPHEFVSFFINVWEEEDGNSSDLFDCNYKANELKEKLTETNQMKKQPTLPEINESNSEALEKYEKTLPAHGDKIFHTFISKIQKNPGQLLRYIRGGGTPLFLYPTVDAPHQCQHCGGELVYELQLLPTLISQLKLIETGVSHIEFGTVFVLACKRSCWAPNDTTHSEYVVVQREI